MVRLVESKSWVLYPFHYDDEELPYDIPKDAKNATNSSQLQEKSNNSGADLKNPPTLAGSQDKDPVADLMTPPKPTNMAVILDLIGGTNDGKQGSPNSEPSPNKGNSIGNEGGGRSSTNEASGSPPVGGGGAEGKGDAGGNGNGGCDPNNPNKGNPGGEQGSQKKKRLQRLKKKKGGLPSRSSPRHKTPPDSSMDQTQLDSNVKQLFTTGTKTRRYSRNKNKGNKNKANDSTADFPQTQANHSTANSARTKANGPKDPLLKTATPLPPADLDPKTTTSMPPVNKNDKTAPSPPANKDSNPPSDDPTFVHTMNSSTQNKASTTMRRQLTMMILLFFPVQSSTKKVSKW
jgi:hypothetical protein